MKALSYFFILLISLLIIHCSNEIPITNDPIGLELGKVSLRIDKENAPDNVVLVEAFLTRADHDTIYGALNILTSTTGDILFENISAGEWHLKVDAKDSSGTVVYTGETEINVHTGVLTYVNLTLIPTGLGTGSIYIYVTWGNMNAQWIDYENNPVLTSGNTYWDYAGVKESIILYEEGIYKMWYLGLANSAVSHVGYAISSDGINWTKPFDYPVLSPGVIGAWDERGVSAGAIIRDETGSYKMYYCGWTDPDGQWHIGLATSSDGINWQKHPSPVLYGTAGWESKLVPSSVLKIGGVYYLYYSGSAVNCKIGLATSSDGINWTRYSGNPIMQSTQSWEGTGIYYPSVIEDEGIYKMIYMNRAQSGMGMATSTDGINWIKDTENSFFTKENTANNWADEFIAYPFLLKRGNEYRVYYSGIEDPNSIVYRIGFMRKFDN